MQTEQARLETRQRLDNSFALQIERANQDWLKRRDNSISETINEELDRLKDEIIELVYYYLERYGSDNGEIVRKRARKTDIDRVLLIAVAFIATRLDGRQGEGYLEALTEKTDLTVGRLMEIEISLLVDISTENIVDEITEWNNELVDDEVARQQAILEVEPELESLYDNLVYRENIEKNQNNMKELAIAGILLLLAGRAREAGIRADLNALLTKHITKNESFYLRRITVSEAGRKQIAIQREFYEESGYTQYLYIAEPDACEVCIVLHGEVFQVADMSEGVNSPLMHPFCRCSTVPYLDEDELDTRYSYFYT